MAIETIDYRFVLRRGLAAEWTAQNGVLFEGEFGLELDTGKLKIGDGSTPWNSLPYAVVAAAADQTGIAGAKEWVGEHTFTRDLRINAGASTARILFSANAGLFTDLTFETSGVARWVVRKTNAAETGSDAGSHFIIRRFTDAGAPNGTPLEIRRDTGDMIWSGAFYPNSDNAFDFGKAGNRIKEYWGVNATINTSDARLKSTPRYLTQNEIKAAQEIARLPMVWQWLSAIQEKGPDARLHCGPTVQAVMAIMQAHDIDPFRWGAICYDEWPEQQEIIESWEDEYDEEGRLVRKAGSAVVQEYRPAGNCYSLRPVELLWFTMAGKAAADDALDARVTALEG
ncbi:tail fiber domain-containing protein [Marilutibacter alkalisoli]|uniref:Tail fiber domain-containing protein n=1 Tax=Marilutibacter alkalisoli TaxID=2591633 RepID=A0A514BU56_9GAMM|nr:tail fiber domain-containing protein [Lysobacter alkalisoli]QDH70835.1 tail fiber domain-containing protein [Lysobacter alkalisoli]